MLNILGILESYIIELEETSEILNLPSSFYRSSNKCEEFSDLFLPNYRMVVDG